MTPVAKLKSETIVDRLGNLKADIAKLAKIEKELIDELKKRGDPEIDGELFRATVSLSEATVVNGPAVRELLGDAYLAKHGLLSTRTQHTVRVVAQLSRSSILAA